IGDAARIQAEIRHTREFSQLIDSNRATIPPHDYTTMQQSLERMSVSLLDAAEASAEEASSAITIETTSKVYTGTQGRPRLEIDREVLATALQHRGVNDLAEIFDCNPRTIRRRAIEYGLVEPGAPVYVDYEDEESGQCVRIYNPEQQQEHKPNNSGISDAELDVVTVRILEIFPSFGRRMITGHLRHLGHNIPQERIRASYERVQGMPAYMVSRPMGHRTYWVAGPNALWHHDGQHGLIRYRIVIHGFVDGYSRMITGMRAHDNNRKDTVAALSHDARAVHGTPSRVRGDHGVENLEVAEWMETNFGVERGSYIWGRSVHNIRIERLWRDVTRGFGQKWKEFFRGLEAAAGLCPDWNAHIWLLHHLFLPSVNEEAMEWIETWNHHTVTIHSQRDRSPRDMFFFGQLTNGWRDMALLANSDDFAEPDPLEAADIAGYGIDWDDLEDRGILRHHAANNEPEVDNVFASFGSNQPTELSYVEIPTFDSPLTDDQIGLLDEHISQSPHAFSSDMGDRRSLWVECLQFCRLLLSHSQPGN
ncbi:hypothetical protein V5O48_017012, partial [Marasmius crinis-equi]